MSTSGNSALGACVAKPTFSPIYSIGASSRSPSPITIVPSICTASIVLRMASTATSSALCRSPKPIVRAAAIAPFSTTRRNSRLSCSSILPSEKLGVKCAAPMYALAGALPQTVISMSLRGAWTARDARPNLSGRRYALLVIEDLNPTATLRYHSQDENLPMLRSFVLASMCHRRAFPEKGIADGLAHLGWPDRNRSLFQAGPDQPKQREKTHYCLDLRYRRAGRSADQSNCCRKRSLRDYSDAKNLCAGCRVGEITLEVRPRNQGHATGPRL